MMPATAPPIMPTGDEEERLLPSPADAMGMKVVMLAMGCVSLYIVKVGPLGVEMRCITVSVSLSVSQMKSEYPFKPKLPSSPITSVLQYGALSSKLHHD